MAKAESKNSATDTDRIDLSVVIITLNEARNLDRCLASLPSGVEVIVVDSGSDDTTVAIARQHGARVIHHDFSNFAEQKNVALAAASRTWVLSMDADEECSASLRESLALGEEMRAARPHVKAFRLTRRLVFMNRQLRWGKTQDAPIRLMRLGASRFVGDIHEKIDLAPESLASYPIGFIRHYSYHDLSDYFRRFNRYTSSIADSKLKNAAPDKHSAIPGLRHWLRPWFEFLQRYIFRLGFLDGYPGYTYALLSSIYAYVKYAKLIERLQSKRRGGS